jgi:hypothetical protein
VIWLHPQHTTKTAHGTKQISTLVVGKDLLIKLVAKLRLPLDKPLQQGHRKDKSQSVSAAIIQQAEILTVTDQ